MRLRWFGLTDIVVVYIRISDYVHLRSFDYLYCTHQSCLFMIIS